MRYSIYLSSFMAKIVLKISFIVALCLLFVCVGYAQNTNPTYIPKDIYMLSQDSFAKYPQAAIPLQRKGWKYKEGDEVAWSKTTYNDSSWQFCRSTQLHYDSIPKDFWKGIAWFRLHFKVSEELKNTILELNIRHYGASEIYLDGKLIKKFGTVSALSASEKCFFPTSVYMALPLNGADEHILAIRYSNQNANLYRNRYGNAYPFAGFTSVFSADFQQKLDERTVNYLSVFANFVLLGGLALGFWLINLSSFLLFSRDKILLWSSLFMGTVTGAMLLNYRSFELYENIQLIVILAEYSRTFGNYFFVLAYMGFIYSAFYENMPKKLYIFIGITILLGIIDNFVGFSTLNISNITRTSVRIFIIFGLVLEIIRVMIVAIWRKKPSSTILGIGLFVFFVAIFPLNLAVAISPKLLATLPQKAFNLSYFIAFFAILLSMTLYIARRNSKLNRTLLSQIVEVKALSGKSILQEQEKQRILNNQKFELEQQVELRTKELKDTNEELSIIFNTVNQQKRLIEESHKSITSSISYAKRIQDSMLPLTEKIVQYLGKDNFFILNKPRDVVSGDFYWFHTFNNEQVIVNNVITTIDSQISVLAVADCTGHGVPGAFMSMIGSQMLDEIVIQNYIVSPEKILGKLHKEVRRILKQETTDSRDGMDIAIVVLSADLQEKENKNSPKFNTLAYAGAMNAAYLVKIPNLDPLQIDKNEVQNREIMTLQATKFPIGGHQSSQEIERVFKKQILDLQELRENYTLLLYLPSDGYQDQFGGINNHKFMVRRFRELLTAIADLPLQAQQQELKTTIESFMDEGKEKQIDDILVFGIKL